MNTGPNPFADDVFAVSPRDLGLPRSDKLQGYNARQSLAVFVNAPWYHVRHLRDRRLLTQYGDGSGYLPDCLSKRAVWSRDYKGRLVANPVALKPQHQPRNEHDRAVFVNFIQ